MKIYDCFTFYNELDLLEIRLQELYNTVDYFVIVESNQTFTNRPKEFLFEQNQQRYAAWADKIIHVKWNSKSHANAWDNEADQRNAIMQGLVDAADDDIVIISDVDEVLRAEAVAKMRSMDCDLYGLRMPLYNFKFNYMRTTPGQYDVWGMACKRSLLNDTVTPEVFRDQRFQLNGFAYNYHSAVAIIEHAGWHFGYLGNEAHLRDKAQSFSHTEVNTPEFLAQIDIEKSIAEGKEWNRAQPARYEPVVLSDYFPKSITENQQRYQQYILDNAAVTVQNILPFA